MRRIVLIAATLSLIIGLSLTLLSQTPKSQTRRPGEFIVDVNLVELPVSIFDKDGNVIEGLTKDNFQVLEDNTAQEISLFKHEDIPLSLGIVIDNSGSMRSKKDRVHSAALSFVKESNSDDQTFVVAFDSTAWLQQDFTGSMGDLVDAMDSLDPRLETAMYDAIYLSVDHVKTGRLDKKALLVISDGEDNASKWGYNKVLEHVQKAKDIVIYAVGIFDESDSRSGGLFRKSPQKKAREGLTEIAETSGGQAFFPKNIDEVAEICKRIARDLRNRYTIGYTSKNIKQDGSYRKVTVKLINPPKNAVNAKLKTREGYFAQGGAPGAEVPPPPK
jgi:Ca-activated chloride channel family protein